MTGTCFAVALGLTVILMVPALMDFGLTGAAIFDLASPIVRIAYGEELRIAPRSWRPLWMNISLLWPAAFLPAAWLASRLFPTGSHLARFATVAALVMIWGIALPLYFYAVARYP